MEKNWMHCIRLPNHKQSAWPELKSKREGAEKSMFYPQLALWLRGNPLVSFFISRFGLKLRTVLIFLCSALFPAWNTWPHCFPYPKSPQRPYLVNEGSKDKTQKGAIKGYKPSPRPCCLLHQSLIQLKHVLHTYPDHQHYTNLDIHEGWHCMFADLEIGSGCR